MENEALGGNGVAMSCSMARRNGGRPIPRKHWPIAIRWKLCHSALSTGDGDASRLNITGVVTRTRRFSCVFRAITAAWMWHVDTMASRIELNSMEWK